MNRRAQEQEPTNCYNHEFSNAESQMFVTVEPGRLHQAGDCVGASPLH